MEHHPGGFGEPLGDEGHDDDSMQAEGGSPTGHPTHSVRMMMMKNTGAFHETI